MSMDASRKLLADLVGLHHMGERVDAAQKQAARALEQHHQHRAGTIRQLIPSAGVRTDDLEEEYLDSVRESHIAQRFA